jgi:hypothetical protein
VTPTSGASSVSFTSISGYKKLLVRVTKPQTAAASSFNLRFNSDSAANYSYSSISTYTQSGTAFPSSTVATDATSISLGSSSQGANVSSFILINETNTAGVKTFLGGTSWSESGIGLAGTPNLNGQYYASAQISTVTLSISSTFTASGKVELYGVLS